MSSLGYAIAFMICSAPDACETTALRASRFASLAQCQAALPEALRIAGRTKPDRANLIARCRNLDELCPSRVTGADAPTARLALVRTQAGDLSSPAVMAVLSVLCAPPPEQGC